MTPDRLTYLKKCVEHQSKWTDEVLVMRSELRDFLAAREEAKRLRVLANCDLLSSMGDRITLAFSNPADFDAAYELLEKLTGDAARQALGDNPND